MRPTYIDTSPHCPKCNQEFDITIRTLGLSLRPLVKPNEHDDELELHPTCKPDVIRYNVGGRSYVISDEKL